MLATEAAHWVVRLSAADDPAPRAAAMAWAAISVHHAVALARAEAVWDATARLSAVYPVSIGLTAERASPPRRIGAIDGKMAVVIVGLSLAALAGFG